MSKRFGRNQKRKMRENLAELDKQLAQEKRNVEWQKNLARDNAYTVQRTQEVLGDYFSTLPLKELNIQHDQDFLKLQSTSAPMNFNPYYAEKVLQSLEVKLMLLETVKLSAYKDELRNRVVVGGSMPSGPYLAMSLDAMVNMSNHHIEYLIVNQLVPHLVNQIKLLLEDKKTV